jgi:hypothetical protein
MSEFGHAIGAPPHNGQARPYGQNVPFETDEAHLQEELHNIVDIHAQARQRGEAGDLTGARTMLEDALATGELRLGREDPRLAPLMVDLATIARRLGNLTEARNQLRRAYAIIVASAGPEHATSLSIEGRLAAVVYRLGEPTEAYDWHLADAGRRVLGSEHPAVRGAQQRLAASAHTPTVGGRAAAGGTGRSAVVERGQPGVGDRCPDLGCSATGDVHPGRRRCLPTAAGHHRCPAPPLPPRDVEVWPEPPPLPRGDGPIQRRSGHGGGVALVASLGAVILVAAAVVALQTSAPGRRARRA